jgi:hypothetical protein
MQHNYFAYDIILRTSYCKRPTLNRSKAPRSSLVGIDAKVYLGGPRLAAAKGSAEPEVKRSWASETSLSLYFYAKVENVYESTITCCCSDSAIFLGVC